MAVKEGRGEAGHRRQMPGSRMAHMVRIRAGRNGKNMEDKSMAEHPAEVGGVGSREEVEGLALGGKRKNRCRCRTMYGVGGDKLRRFPFVGIYFL